MRLVHGDGEENRTRTESVRKVIDKGGREHEDKVRALLLTGF